MFTRAWRVATIGGVEVRVDPGLVVIALLIAWSFQGNFSERFGGGTALVMATAGAFLFFLSVLAHELGHALEARYRGMRVSGVTLFLFGGVTEMHDEAETPGAEFAIAAVGPFLSLVSAAVFGLLTHAIDWYGGPAQMSAVLGLLGWLNLGLAIFNLVPGAPLDGGRVLRAVLWRVTGDRRRAQRGAAWAGQGVAATLWALAVRDLATGAPTAGAVWLFLVGWFLWNAARGERAVAAYAELVDGKVAGGLPVSPVDPVRADVSVSIQVDRMQLEGDRVAPVARDGEVVGAFVLDDVDDMHPQDQTFRLVEEVMRHGEDLPLIRATQPVTDVVEALRKHSVALVELTSGVVTTLTANQVRQALQLMRDRTTPLPIASGPTDAAPSPARPTADDTDDEGHHGAH